MPFGIDDAAMAAAGAAAIGSAGDIIGQLIKGNQDRAATGKQMRWQDANIQKAMDFQREMSSTAYQRSVADMKKAGLNPMLLASKGFSPASVPSGGGTGSASTPQYPNIGSSLPKSVASALDLLTAKAQIENLNSQSTKNIADAKKTVAATKEVETKGDVWQDVGDIYRNVSRVVKDYGFSAWSNVKNRWNSAHKVSKSN